MSQLRVIRFEDFQDYQEGRKSIEEVKALAFPLIIPIRKGKLSVIKEARQMMTDGLSRRATARELGMAESTLRRWLKEQ